MNKPTKEEYENLINLLEEIIKITEELLLKENENQTSIETLTIYSCLIALKYGFIHNQLKKVYDVINPIAIDFLGLEWRNEQNKKIQKKQENLFGIKF